MQKRTGATEQAKIQPMHALVSRPPRKNRGSTQSEQPLFGGKSIYYWGIAECSRSKRIAGNCSFESCMFPVFSELNAIGTVAPTLPKVEVLLATFNGASFLPAQINSIFSQTWPNISVIAGDDGSTDETMTILKDWERATARMHVLHSQPQGGAMRNFTRLIQESSASYVAFSDQDDVWDPDKLSISMGRMLEEEERRGTDTPILVYTDLRLIDSGGRLLSTSLWQKARVRPQVAICSNMLAQNLVTGCSMLVNRALLDLACPIPSQAIMHDYWFALVASAFGAAIPISQPLVSYRQHATNLIGAGRSLSLAARIKRIYTDPELQTWISRAAYQARAFGERFKDRLPPDAIAAVETVTFLPTLTCMRRIHATIKHGIVRTEFWNELQFLARMSMGEQQRVSDNEFQ
jgi:glycosyltransferase involved in cell wall biosynthesis